MKLTWEKWVEREIRMYLCRSLDLDYLEQKINAMDQDIYGRISSLNGLPKAKGIVSSLVERQVVRRERNRVYWEHKRELLLQRIEVFEQAFQSLSDIQKKVIRFHYFTLAHIDNFIKEMGLDKNSYLQIKQEALNTLYAGIREGYSALFKRIKTSFVKQQVKEAL